MVPAGGKQRNVAPSTVEPPKADDKGSKKGPPVPPKGPVPSVAQGALPPRTSPGGIHTPDAATAQIGGAKTESAARGLQEQPGSGDGLARKGAGQQPGPARDASIAPSGAQGHRRPPVAAAHESHPVSDPKAVRPGGQAMGGDSQRSGVQGERRVNDGGAHSPQSRTAAGSGQQTSSHGDMRGGQRASGHGDTGGSQRASGQGNMSGSQQASSHGHMGGGQQASGQGNMSGGQQASSHGHMSGSQQASSHGHISGGQQSASHSHMSGGQQASNHSHMSGGQQASSHGHMSGGQQASSHGHMSGGQQASSHGHMSGGQQASSHGHVSGGQQAFSRGHMSGSQQASSHGHASSSQPASGHGHTSASQPAFSHGHEPARSAASGHSGPAGTAASIGHASTAERAHGAGQPSVNAAGEPYTLGGVGSPAARPRTEGTSGAIRPAPAVSEGRAGGGGRSQPGREGMGGGEAAFGGGGDGQPFLDGVSVVLREGDPGDWAKVSKITPDGKRVQILMGTDDRIRVPGTIFTAGPRRRELAPPKGAAGKRGEAAGRSRLQLYRRCHAWSATDSTCLRSRLLVAQSRRKSPLLCWFA